MLETFASSLLEGLSETILNAEREWRLRRASRTARLVRPPESPARHYTWLEDALHGPLSCRRRESRPEAQNLHGWRAPRGESPRYGTIAPLWGACLPRHVQRPNGVPPEHPNVFFLSALRPPLLFGVIEAKVQTPDFGNARAETRWAVLKSE